MTPAMLGGRVGSEAGDDRSTKAGVMTPAMLYARTSPTGMSEDAQRRPG